MTETLRINEVHDGDELPELVVPVSATTIVLGALASRDWRPMHHDHDFARATRIRLRPGCRNEPAVGSGPNGTAGRGVVHRIRPVRSAWIADDSPRLGVAPAPVDWISSGVSRFRPLID